MAGAWGQIAGSPHVVLGTSLPMATEYYDPTSEAPVGEWTETPHSGSCDLVTGRCSDDDFPSNGPWKQV